MSRALLAAALLGALAPAAPQIFRSSADAVRVDVLVSDGRVPIGGLTTANFELLDNGVRQTIQDLQIAEVPFSMMMALDVSSSMAGGPLDHLKDGANAALEALHPEDRAAVLAFSEAVTPATAWTSSHKMLLPTIAGLKANGSTSLFDAIVSAIVQRDPEPGRRNLLIIFSDGRDTASWLPDFAALDLVTRTDIVVYGVTLTNTARVPPPNLDYRSGIRLSREQAIYSSTDFLGELAERSGGDRMSSSLPGLRRTFAKIVNDFRSRYVLTYMPNGVAATGWHRLEVRLVGRKGNVTARRGYERGAL